MANSKQGVRGGMKFKVFIPATPERGFTPGPYWKRSFKAINISLPSFFLFVFIEIINRRKRRDKQKKKPAKGRGDLGRTAIFSRCNRVEVIPA